MNGEFSGISILSPFVPSIDSGLALSSQSKDSEKLVFQPLSRPPQEESTEVRVVNPFVWVRPHPRPLRGQGK